MRRCLARGVSGCLGPKAVRYTRMRYNEVVRATNDEQLLLNIVRLRYADSPIFVDLPNITSQFEVAGQGNYLGGYGNETPGRASLGFGDLSLRDTPTLSYHPREGREIAKALLTPLSSDMLIVVNAGANLEQLLLFAMNDINDVPNAPDATVLLPDARWRQRGIRSWYPAGSVASARRRNRVGVRDGRGIRRRSSDPIPQAGGAGSRPLKRGKRRPRLPHEEGQPDDRAQAAKGPLPSVRPAYVNSPEMHELARIFRLTPGLDIYNSNRNWPKKSNGSLPSPLGSDTIYLNLRSVLQIMTFLSKGCLASRESTCGLGSHR